MTESPYLNRLELGGKGPVYRCLHCYGHIRSLNRWNMVSCKCGKSAVDGGDSYTKASFSDLPPEPLDLHEKKCDAWTELECTCAHRWDSFEDLENYDEPPIRNSKTAKPKMGVSGRSIFQVARKMASRYGKKKL